MAFRTRPSILRSLPGIALALAVSSVAPRAFAQYNQTPPPGSILGTIPVTILDDAPVIEIAQGPQAMDPFGFGAGFGTSCDGYNFADPCVLGDPRNLGTTGDGYGADGVPRAPPIQEVL